MPTVPRYQTQVGRAPLPGARLGTQVPAAAFAPRESIDLSGLQRIAGHIYEQEREKADQVALLEAERQLSELETELLYRPETGTLNRRGKDALPASQEAKEAWQKRVGEIGAGLTSDRQRLAYTRLTNERTANVNRTVERHVSQEMDRYDSEQTEAFLGAERNAAVANYNDPERVAEAIQNQRRALAEHANRLGKSKEWLDAATETAVSKTHTGVINRHLAVGDDRLASAYFAKHKDEISGEDVANLEQALQEGSLRGESQRLTDQIMKSAKSRAEGLAEARKIDDPKLRDLVEQRVNQEFSTRRAIEKEEQDDLYLRATNMVDGRPNVPVRSVIPPHIWSKLSLEQRRALENRAARDDDSIDDSKVWLDFLALTPEQVRGLSRADFETKWWSKMGKSHRERAASYWDQIKDAQDTTRDPNLSATLTFNNRVGNTLRTSGVIDPNKSTSKFSEDEATTYARFETEAARRVQDYELNQLGGKRRATGEEVQKILDELVVEKVFIDRKILPDRERLSVDVPQDQRNRSYVPYDKIPKDDRNMVENLLRSQRKRITVDKVQRAYAAYILRDRALFNTIINEP